MPEWLFYGNMGKKRRTRQRQFDSRNELRTTDELLLMAFSHCRGNLFVTKAGNFHLANGIYVVRASSATKWKSDHLLSTIVPPHPGSSMAPSSFYTIDARRYMTRAYVSMTRARKFFHSARAMNRKEMIQKGIWQRRKMSCFSLGYKVSLLFILAHAWCIHSAT